jgi:hypothetical protein
MSKTYEGAKQDSHIILPSSMSYKWDDLDLDGRLGL